MKEIVLKIVELLNNYYHLIILFMVFILFIISLFKPSKKSDFIRVFKLVNKAEKLFPERNSGAVKLAYVIKNLPDIDTNKVIELVDEILQSPQAKKIE